MDINYDVITFISKYFYFEKSGVNFTDIIKNVTFFVKTILKYSRKVKRIRNFV